jgi:type IV pilus assembly protein PilA
MSTDSRIRLMSQRALLARLAASRRGGLLQAGFTLMELLTVVVIMGILAAIATPTILNQQARARVIAANTTAIQAAQSCASLQITGQEASWVTNRDPNIVATATCPTSGTAQVFKTAYTSASGITTEAEATLRADGSTQLTVCAEGPGAAKKATSTPPKCEY